MKKTIFSFRSEYYDYATECLESNEQVWPFRTWFLTSYHYDIIDEIPTGTIFNIN